MSITGEAPAAKARLIVVLPALMLALAISALDQQIVNTALPRIVAEMGGLNRLSWVVTAFLLTQTCTVPLYGKLSDLHGRKLMFIIAISIFLAGSALCGVARTMTQLIVFRGLQGLGAGGIYTLVSITIGDFVPPKDRGKYQGLFTGVFVICSVGGPVVGGLLTSAFTWRSVFLINLPFGAIVLLVLGLALPSSKRANHKIDYAGALLIAVATMPLLLALSWGGTVHPWVSPIILGLGVFAIVAYAVLIAHERRASEPILGVNLVGDRTFRWGVLTSGIVGFGFYGSNILLPLYFQIALGLTPAIAGALLIPQAIGSMLASLAGGQWVSRSGRYRETLIGGVCIFTAAFAGMAALSARPSPLWSFEACLFVLGLGGSLCILSLTVCVQNAVEHRHLGMATSTMTFFNSLLGAAGVALFGSILAGQLHAYLLAHGAAGLNLAPGRGLDPTRMIPPVVSAAYRHAISTAFFASAGLNLLTIAAAFKVPGKKLVTALGVGHPRANAAAA